MLRVDVITLFPRMIEVPAAESILGKAQERGLLRVTTRDLRPFGIGKHQITDDAPYGGGAGMVMKPEPLVAAIEAAQQELSAEDSTRKPLVILMDPQGAPFVQATAARLAQESSLILVCGRYEGVDERVRAYVDEAISVGDFVLTGGEPAALCVIDAVARLRPGVLGNEVSATTESFTAGLLEGPQYTRPPNFRGQGVPPMLLSGDHAKIARWRLKEGLRRTLAVRPEVVDKLDLNESTRKVLEQLRFEGRQGIGAPPGTAPVKALVVAGSGEASERGAAPDDGQPGGDGDANEGD
jgi:tRNA (guanine37-N1)-methyltransferase